MNMPGLVVLEDFSVYCDCIGLEGDLTSKHLPMILPVDNLREI